MAKYYGSVWGIIKGKVGEGIGQLYKGIPVVKAYRKHKNHPGTLEWMRKARRGEVPKNSVSIKSVNHHLVFALITFFAGKSKEIVIRPIWDNYAKKKRYRFGGYPLFIKQNVFPVEKSIPNRNKFCGPKNMPDLGRLLITPWSPEPAIPVECKYNRDTGEVVVKWDTPSWVDWVTSPEDEAYVMCTYWKIGSIELWDKVNKPWKVLKIWGNGIDKVGTRGDESASIQIEKRLNSRFLTAYLFFRLKGKKGYKYSKTYSVKP